MPMPHSAAGQVAHRGGQLREQLVDSLQARLGAGGDVGRLVAMTQDAAVEVGDGDVDAGRAEVGDEYVTGVGAEAHLPWRAAACARTQLVVDDQAQLDELGNALGDDAAAQAGAGDELGPRPRSRLADLVEDRHERVERLAPDVGHLLEAHRARSYALLDDLLHLTCRSTIISCNSPGTHSPRSRVAAGVRPASEIGAAVIGGGFIGTVHVEALRRLGVRVHGILTSSAERSAERASQLGIDRGYGSLEELLDDDRVEIVHVTSPNHLHHPQVRRILDADRHVVCEKPLAMTAEESADLVERAASSGKVNAVNFNIRFYPLNQHAHELIAAGELGDVRLVAGRYYQDWLLLETDWNWRLEPDRGGALRAVGDIGSHWLDLLAFITGQRISSVMADLATFIPTRRQPAGPVETFSTERAAETLERDIATEDVATILLRFENGARGSVAISQLSPGRKNSLQYEVDGSAAAAFWDSEQPDQLWIGHRDRPNEILIRNPALMGPAGAGRRGAPRRARRGIRGHLQGALPRHLRRRRRRGAVRPTDVSDLRRRA